MRTLLLALPLALFAPLPAAVAQTPAPATAAAAKTYAVQPGSTLGFRATYQGEAFDGRFARFTPVIRFDPANLAGSHFNVTIDLASVGTDNAERDEMLAGGEFFDSTSVPQATYVAEKFRHAGGDRYVAEGTLTLRGVSKPVPLAFTWTPGTPAVLRGEATLSRLAFKVGEGDWEDTGLLPDEVKVTTELRLQAK